MVFMKLDLEGDEKENTRDARKVRTMKPELSKLLFPLFELLEVLVHKLEV
jgi:hypothetical protein